MPRDRECDAISWLVEALRQQPSRQRHRHIVWITSHYGEIETAPKLTGKTHPGKPSCVKDSWAVKLLLL